MAWPGWVWVLVLVWRGLGTGLTGYGVLAGCLVGLSGWPVSREASGIQTEFKAAGDHTFSTDEHLNQFLSE